MSVLDRYSYFFKIIDNDEMLRRDNLILNTCGDTGIIHIIRIRYHGG